jgi:type I restriction enzyme S subunit
LYAIPAPTKPIQEEIVKEIESRLSIYDKLEETVQQSLKKIEYLRQSILKKAFEGKLVPQDPNDLPACELLKQIKIKKDKMSKNEK